MEGKDDSELLDDLRRGREIAQRRFWKIHYSVLCDYITRALARGRRAEDAEEIAREAFLRLFLDIANYRGEASLRSWLYKLAHNAAIDYYRSSPQKQRERELPLSMRALSEDDVGTKAQEAGPKDRIVADEEAARIRQAIDTLPLEHRTVILLRIVQRLSTKETAEVLERSEPAVKMLLLRATQNLRAALSRDRYFTDSNPNLTSEADHE